MTPFSPTPIALESAANVAFGHAKDDVARAADAFRKASAGPVGPWSDDLVAARADLEAALDRLTALGWAPGPERVGTALAGLPGPSRTPTERNPMTCQPNPLTTCPICTAGPGEDCPYADRTPGLLVEAPCTAALIRLGRKSASYQVDCPRCGATEDEGCRDPIARAEQLASPAVTAGTAGVRAGSGEAVGWQPIQTAPKDGKRIIIALYIGRRCVWVAEDGWNADRDEWSDLGGNDGPTHWMPLPEPPGSVAGPGDGG